MSVEEAPRPSASAQPAPPARPVGTATKRRNALIILGLASAFTMLVTQPGQSAAAHAHRSLAAGAAAAPTVDCPQAADQVGTVPAAAQAEVDRNLALLDTQVAEANKRLATSAGQGGPNFVQNAILGPLADKRKATLARIATAIGRTGQAKPAGLENLASCTLNNAGAGADAGAGAGDASATPTATATASASAAPTAPGNGNAGGGEAAGLGPFAGDFIDIRQVPPKARAAARGRNASRGTFVSRCGNNENGHRNPDNFIVAPGVSNGAQHTHDYVGNLSADGFSTDATLKASRTTCRNGDKSTYFWPVLRDQSKGGIPQDGNVGQILQPQVKLEFRGNQRTKVRAMPQFLRVITGDAKTLTNGVANARAQWTCTGFTNRVTDKYPLCPRRSSVVRVLDFPSCLSGNSTDSPNHRTHIVFPDVATGACPSGTRAVPQLRMTLTYKVANPRNMALDSFPNQFHNPATDHGDFANLMPKRLMNRAVSCINKGRRC